MKAVRSIAKVVGWIAVGVFLLVGAFFEFGGGIANPPETWNRERAAEIADMIQDEFDVGPIQARCIVGFVRERYDYDEWAGMTKDEAIAAGERQAEALDARCGKPVGEDRGVADRAYCNLFGKFVDAPGGSVEEDEAIGAVIQAEDSSLGPTLRAIVDRMDPEGSEDAYFAALDDAAAFCLDLAPPLALP